MGKSTRPFERETSRFYLDRALIFEGSYIAPSVALHTQNVVLLFSELLQVSLGSFFSTYQCSVDKLYNHKVGQLHQLY